MATGANTTPLGRLHPILAARQTPSPSPVAARVGVAGGGGGGSGSRDPELQKHLEAAKRAASAIFSGEPARKKRKSRWGSEQVKTIIPGLPTVLPANMSDDQQKLYLLHLKVEETSRHLRSGDLGIPLNPAERSPSPEPIYSYDGKRLNTREVRVRKRLEEQRHELVQQATKLNPEYKPPADYKPVSKKFEDKVFIPQDHHPETNFVGLLIGPRGNTLKQLERDSNTKIMIRGKGATKEGKLGRAGLPQPGEDEPLHALITGNTAEAVKGSVDKIKSIIQSGIDVPGNDNDLKKLQLQQLAELNGTFKPLDVLRCRNCGSSTHKSWECTEHQNITSSVICTVCGSGGHIASDCKQQNTAPLAPGEAPPPPMTVLDKAKMDSEYLSLMKELGESVPGSSPTATSQAPRRTHYASGGTNVPPPTSLTGQNNPHGIKLGEPPTHHLMPHPPPHMMMHPGAPLPWMHPPPHMMGAPMLGMAPPWAQPMMYGAPMGMPMYPTPPPPPPEGNPPGTAPPPPPPEGNPPGAAPPPPPPDHPWVAAAPPPPPQGAAAPPPPPQGAVAPPPPPPDSQS